MRIALAFGPVRNGFHSVLSTVSVNPGMKESVRYREMLWVLPHQSQFAHLGSTMLPKLLLICVYFATVLAVEDDYSDVVVIGAGMAGASAANLLAERGIGVKVIEARSRVGGRIFSMEKDGKFFEMGAQYIHEASEGNCLFTLANR